MKINAHSGFSLVEMLAALAILSLSGMALMNALTTSTRAATLAEDMALAQLAAQNVLSLHVLDGGQVLGERRGDYEVGGRVYPWVMDLDRTDYPNLIRVRISIYEPNTETVLHSLETLQRTRA